MGRDLWPNVIEENLVFTKVAELVQREYDSCGGRLRPYGDYTDYVLKFLTDLEYDELERVRMEAQCGMLMTGIQMQVKGFEPTENDDIVSLSKKIADYLISEAITDEKNLYDFDINILEYPDAPLKRTENKQ